MSDVQGLQIGAQLQATGVATIPDTGDTLQRAYPLPIRLILEVPVVDFTVGSLMHLATGAILETSAQHNEDLMLQANGQLVGMVKFDVTGDKLAVRMTGVA